VQLRITPQRERTPTGARHSASSRRADVPPSAAGRANSCDLHGALRSDIGDPIGDEGEKHEHDELPQQLRVGDVGIHLQGCHAAFLLAAPGRLDDELLLPALRGLDLLEGCWDGPLPETAGGRVLPDLLHLPATRKAPEDHLCDLPADASAAVLPEDEELGHRAWIACPYEREPRPPVFAPDQERVSLGRRPVMVEVAISKQAVLVELTPVELGEVVHVELHEATQDRLVPERRVDDLDVHASNVGGRVTAVGEGTGATLSAVEHLPLSVLLARPLADLTREFEGGGAGRDGVPSVPMWCGLLWAVPPDGVEQTDLPALARLSRRAVRQGAGAAGRGGWLAAERNPGRRGAWLGLTPYGRTARETWDSLTATIEARWSTGIGAADTGRLRAALEDVVGHFDLELPHYPISYGSADRSVTGGRHKPAQPGPPRIPAHGQDWVPVVRAGGDTVAGLATTALLSQALVAFAIDYEAAGFGSMAAGAGLASGFGAASSAPLRALPRRLGVNGSGKSGLERHGLVIVDPGPSTDRAARLTPLGERVRDSYTQLVTEVENAWRDRYGAASVLALRSALEDVNGRLADDPPDDVWVTMIR